MEKSRSNIRGVIFDMDGTILDTERLYYRLWMELSGERGYRITDEMLGRMRGGSLQNGKRIFEAENPGYDFYEERKLRMERVFECIEKEGVPKKPGLDELFDWLMERGYRIALGSSTIGIQVSRYLEKIDYTKKFDFICSGDMIEHGKPEPDIFLYCAERLGLAPSECVVVEDSHNGIRAAHAAGCFVLGIPDLNELSPVRELMDAELKALPEVISWLSGKEASANSAADAGTGGGASGESRRTAQAVQRVARG